MIGALDDLAVGEGEGGVGAFAFGKTIGFEDMEFGGIGFDDEGGSGLVGEIEESSDMVGAGPGRAAEASFPDFASGAEFDALGDTGFIEDKNMIADDDARSDALLIGFDSPGAMGFGDVPGGHAIREADADGGAFVAGHRNDQVIASERVRVTEFAQSSAVPQLLSGGGVESGKLPGEWEDEFVAFAMVVDDEWCRPRAFVLFEILANRVREFSFPEGLSCGFVEGEEIGFGARSGVDDE